MIEEIVIFTAEDENDENYEATEGESDHMGIPADVANSPSNHIIHEHLAQRPKMGLLKKINSAISRMLFSKL